MTDVLRQSIDEPTPIVRWWALFAGIYGCSVVVAAVVHDAGAVALLGFAATIPSVGLLAAIDTTTRQLPRAISYAAFLMALPLLIIDPRRDGDGRWTSAHGALFMLGITATIHLLGRGALGRGDVHFSPLLGAVAGWFGLRLVVATWLIASILGGLVAVVVMLRRSDRTARFAYGPLLVLGLCVALLTIVG